MADTMNIEVLQDGTIKIVTDKISQVNHMTAEAFLRNVAVAAGGRQERAHRHGVLGAAVHSVQHILGRKH